MWKEKRIKMMKKKIKVLFYVAFALLIIFGFIFVNRYIERYIQSFVPQFFSKMNLGEISFSSMRIDYFSQAIRFKGLKYRLKRENFETEAEIDKGVIKFKRILTEWKKPLRGIEVDRGYVKVIVQGENAGNGGAFFIPPFLDGSSVSLKNFHFEIHAGEVKAEGEVISFQTDKISEVIKGSVDLSVQTLVLSSKKIPLRGVSTDFQYKNEELSLFNLVLDSEIATLFAPKLKWEIGKRLDFNFRVANFKWEEFTLGYGIFEGWYDFKNNEVEGRCSFKKAEYREFLAEDGELSLNYSIKNGALFIKDGAVKYRDGFLKIKMGQFSKGYIRFDIELESLPFEHLLLNTGHVESRVFNTYTGKISVGGSLRPLMIKGEAELEARNFSVCEEVYPLECRNSVLKFSAGKADIRFEIRPHGVEIIDVAIYLPDSKGYITGNGTVFFDESLNLNLKIHSLELGYISEIAGIPMGGMMKGEVYITGPFKDVSVYYRGEIKNYLLSVLHFEYGNYTVFYRDETLYYSGAVKTGNGGALLANGFIDFSGEPSIHHTSSFEEVETAELSEMIGLPQSVREEINEISTRWNGSFFMDGSIKGKLPDMFGRLETSSKATYMGEVIDMFSAEGYFSNGEISFKGYGLKGKEVIFEGGYREGMIYAGISGSLKIDSINQVKSADVKAEVYGDIFSPVIAFTGKAQDFSFTGEIEEGMKDLSILSRDFLFYRKRMNSTEAGGCLVDSDPLSYLKIKDLSSVVNGCFIGVFSDGKVKLDAILKNSLVKVGNETFYLREPVKIKGTKGVITFEAGDGFVRLNLMGDNGRLSFRFPGDLLSLFEGYEIKKGFAEGNISFSLNEPFKDLKGSLRFENISFGMKFIKFEKIWGEGELDGRTIKFKIYSEFPAEVKVEGTYSLENGIITATIRTHGIKIRREGINAEVNSSLRGIIEPNKISLNGEVEFTKLFLPFDLSLVKKLPLSESPKGREFEIENLKIRCSDLKIKGSGNELSGRGELLLKGINSINALGKFNFEGKISYLGKEFEMTKGEILWDGSSIIPFLDIIAHTIQEKVYLKGSEISPSYDIYLSVRGPADAPIVELSSSPSLSREDILALLFTGKTIKDIYEAPVKGEGATAKIYEIGSEAILGAEFESLKRISRLDKFTIYPKYSETLHRTTTYMTVGKKIGEELWMEYTRDMNYDEQAFELLWKAGKRFSIKGGWDNLNTKMRTGNSELGNISVDFIFQHEF
jgi:hypothetical protein